MSETRSSTESSAAAPARRSGLIRAVAVLVSLGLLLLAGYFLWPAASDRELLERGRRAVEEGEAQRAAAAAQELLQRDSASVPALRLA
ncbi:MAG: hypothetical protein KDA79_23585, partial [Planctomycetaceae bacterium]|nr:hypothetical protein [Planctomycetaceae bacterium]